MKTKYFFVVAGICIAATVGQTAFADWSDDFGLTSGSATPVGWQTATTPAPNFWGINDGTGTGGGTGWMQITVRNTEFMPASPYEGISRAMNPVYSAPGSAWTASVQIWVGGNNVESFAESSELHVITARGFYAFGVLTGSTNRSVNYAPHTGETLEIWNAGSGQWVYIPLTSSSVSGVKDDTFSIQYIGDGVVNYYLGGKLFYTQTGMDTVDPGISNPTQFGLGTFNFNNGGYNAWFQNASVVTSYGSNPNPSISRSGTNVIVMWPSSKTLLVTTNLAVGKWLTNSYPFTVTNSVDAITIPAPRGNQFFRAQ